MKIGARVGLSQALPVIMDRLRPETDRLLGQVETLPSPNLQAKDSQAVRICSTMLKKTMLSAMF